jgi:fatty-acid desaturase
VGVVVPFAGFLISIGLVWNRWVDGADLALLGSLYLLTAVGVTVGFHRLLTHRSFQTQPRVQRAFAILGSLSLEGSVLDWVADHRKHHAFFGRRRFATDDRSTNVAWLAIPSLGESWHHNHHAFPRSAHHGLRWYELDPSALIISCLETLGLAWNVVRIAPERQAARLQSGAASGSRA